MSRTHRLQPQRLHLVSACALLAVACASPTAPPALPAAAPSAASAHYRLDLPPGWTRIASKEAGQADIYAERDGGRSWLLVRSTSGSAIQLDDLVAFRRDAIFAEQPVREFREKRSYHRNAPQVPVSISRYLIGADVLLVMTAVDGSLGVECVAGTPLGIGRERELLALFESLRFVERTSP